MRERVRESSGDAGRGPEQESRTGSEALPAGERPAGERPAGERQPDRRSRERRTLAEDCVPVNRTSRRKSSSGGSPRELRPKDANRQRRDRRRAQQQARRVDPAKLSAEELVDLYYRSGSKRLRSAIVDRFLDDVAEIARGLMCRLPQSIDIEDLCNAGYSGLLRCLETFDPEHGRSFVSYMRQRVHGSMMDELRAMDWLPRLARARLAQKREARRELSQRLGREPRDAELAEQLGVEVEDLHRSYPGSLATARTSVVANTELDLESLDGSIVGVGILGKELHQTTHPLTEMYHQELVDRIRDLLSDTEWKLVELHYFKGLKLREVAKQLSLSPARICQIHHSVLERLKLRLREEAFSI